MARKILGASDTGAGEWFPIRDESPTYVYVKNANGSSGETVEIQVLLKPSPDTDVVRTVREFGYDELASSETIGEELPIRADQVRANQNSGGWSVHIDESW